MADLYDAILKGDHPRTIPAKLGSLVQWFWKRRLKCELFTDNDVFKVISKNQILVYCV
jgi:hypothetical protein